jgi:hypothetical protein
LDTTTLTREQLNIEDKIRSNLLPWSGQFSPQLVHTFLETYAKAGSLVLDPFMGSGTVLVEAGRLGLPTFGAEINPAAYIMAGIYSFLNIRGPERKLVLDQASASLHQAFTSLPLFDRNVKVTAATADLKRSLVDLWESTSEDNHRRLLEALIVLVDFSKESLAEEDILRTWKKIRRIVFNLPYSSQPIRIANDDARSLPLGGGVVDLVITSPPYINVFNYHQQYRASVEALGWDLLHVARSEIGSNRKHRQNRFLTVIQYCLDLEEALRELLRVCNPDSRIIIVVGRESNVLKTPFYNGDIVASIADRCIGFVAEKRQERVFRNRFGAAIYEDIIHFRPPGQLRKNGESPSAVAEEILRAALQYAPPESMSSLEAALDRISEVTTSPLYTHKWRKGTEHEIANAAS